MRRSRRRSRRSHRRSKKLRKLRKLRRSRRTRRKVKFGGTKKCDICGNLSCQKVAFYEVNIQTFGGSPDKSRPIFRFFCGQHRLSKNGFNWDTTSFADVEKLDNTTYGFASERDIIYDICE